MVNTVNLPEEEQQFEDCWRLAMELADAISKRNQKRILELLEEVRLLDPSAPPFPDGTSSCLFDTVIQSTNYLLKRYHKPEDFDWFVNAISRAYLEKNFETLGIHHD